MTKVAYKITHGDWCRGTHEWFNKYEEAEKRYNELKGNAIWASFEKFIFKKNFFGKTKILTTIMIDGYNPDEEEL